MKRIVPVIFVCITAILISLPLLKTGFYIIHDDQQIARLFLFDQKPMLITLFKNIQTCIQLLYF